MIPTSKREKEVILQDETRIWAVGDAFRQGKKLNQDEMHEWWVQHQFRVDQADWKMPISFVLWVHLLRQLLGRCTHRRLVRCAGYSCVRVLGGYHNSPYHMT